MVGFLRNGFLSYNLLMIQELLKVSIMSLIVGCCTF